MAAAMTDDLITWLRARLDEDERGLRAGLAEYLDTRLEYDFRFRLAEVDAKRRIVDRYEDALDRQQQAAEHSQIAVQAHVIEYEDWVLPALALPYADRPGYREEWRP